MSSNVNKILQVTGVIIQIVNQFGWFIPEEIKPFIIIEVATIQAIFGVLAHYYNPDGTLSGTAWKK